MKHAQDQSNVPAPSSRAQHKITCLERMVADLDFPEPLDLNCLGLHVQMHTLCANEKVDNG
jgi:hypothetical protein